MKEKLGISSISAVFEEGGEEKFNRRREGPRWETPRGTVWGSLKTVGILS